MKMGGPRRQRWSSCTPAALAAIAGVLSLVTALTAPTGAAAAGERQVTVTLLTNGGKPSAIDLRIVFDPAVWAYRDVVEGAAALAAGKDAHNQEIEEGDNSVGLLVSGFNQDTMGDGELLQATFDAVSTAQEVISMHLTDVSVSGAEGELINAAADGWTIVLNPAGPAAPEVVTASQDQTDGVWVAWDPVAGAAGYQVYRSSSVDPGTAQAVTDWLPDDTLYYLDTTAAEPEANSGCAGGTIRHRYYYWVRARDAQATEGVLSAAAIGSRAAAKLLEVQSQTSSSASVLPLPGLGVAAGSFGDLAALVTGSSILLICRHRGRRSAR